MLCYLSMLQAETEGPTMIQPSIGDINDKIGGQRDKTKKIGWPRENENADQL